MMSTRRLWLGITVALCALAGGLMCSLTPALAEPLPDGRVYELVTPIGNANADVYVQNSRAVSPDGGETEHGIPTEMPFEAAADGVAAAALTAVGDLHLPAKALG